MSTLKSLATELETPTNLSLILATVWVLTEIYPLKTSGPTIIGQYANTKMLHMEHNDLIEGILVRISKMRTSRILLETDNSYHGHKTQSHNIFNDLNDEEYFHRFNANKMKSIWFVDSLESFMRLEGYLLNERNQFHRRGYFCFIYTGREPDRLQTLRSIFSRLFRINIVNVNIFLSLRRTVFVYTYFPFSKTKCNDVQPHFHGIFGPKTNYNYSQNVFFPRKLKNMWGCKVNVTTWTELPFVDLDFNMTTGDVIKLEGIEGMLLRLLSNQLNFTMKIVENPKGRLGNGTDPGAIKMLSDGLTNITIGGAMYTKARRDVVEACYPYLHIPLCLAIPFGKMMSSLERLIRPFNNTIWGCLSTTLLFGIFVIFFLKALCKKAILEFTFGKGNRIPFTNFWSIFYGGPTTSAVPQRNFARYLLGLWLFYTLVLRSAYLTQLFVILQDSRARSELNTLQEAFKQNFTFYANAIIVPLLLGATKENITIKILEDEGKSLPELLEFLAENENANIAIAMLEVYIEEYNQDPKNIYHQVNVLPETVVNAPITCYMRKHSYLSKDIDETLLHTMSAGLLVHFQELFWIQQVYKTKKMKAVHSIPLFLLIGLFLIHLALLVLSVIVFLLELWSKYSPLTRRFIDFFNV